MFCSPGVALGVAWLLIDRSADLLGLDPRFYAQLSATWHFRDGMRSTRGEFLSQIPNAIRGGTLGFFFLLFLLRVLLRNPVGGGHGVCIAVCRSDRVSEPWFDGIAMKVREAVLWCIPLPLSW